MRLFKTKGSFRREFKRQLRYAIAAACGFLIIFAWRDAIYNATRSFVEIITESTKVATTNLLTALLLTFIGVLLIILSSKLLKD